MSLKADSTAAEGHFAAPPSSGVWGSQKGFVSGANPSFNGNSRASHDPPGSLTDRMHVRVQPLLLGGRNAASEAK